jgi:tripartite-type tricarboxylate transporter receptor subunit TctC
MTFFSIFRFRRSTVSAIHFFILFGLCAPQIRAEGVFPQKPIKIIFPFAPGTISDTTLRVLGSRVGELMGTSIILDNQTSAGGITAARSVLLAPHDGYTLALLSNSTAISVSLFKKLPFDPVKDFEPIVGISEFSNILAVSGNSNFNNLTTLIAHAKDHPGVLNVGTTGVGSSNHLTALLFKSMAKLNFEVVPFRGPAELFMALQRNDVAMIIQSYGAVKESMINKQIKAVAITNGKRNQLAPDIATVQEQGISGFDVSSWNGLFGPKQTPQPAIQSIYLAFSKALREPEIIKKLNELGVETMPSTPEDLAFRMKNDIRKWGEVIETSKIEKQ